VEALEARELLTVTNPATLLVPSVVSVTPAAGSVLSLSPTQLVVRFNEPVNLLDLANPVPGKKGLGTVDAVWIEGPNGTWNDTMLQSLNAATNEATFVPDDPLPNGNYLLHVSGPLGIADQAGDPLAGDDPSGDFLSAFSVSAPLCQQVDSSTSPPFSGPNLGTLCQTELAAGITLNGTLTASSAGPSGLSTTVNSSPWAQYYHFQMMQTQDLVFTLTGTNLPAGARLDVVDAAGNRIPSTPLPGGGLLVHLESGEYGVGIAESGQPSGKGGTNQGDATYQLRIVLANSNQPVTGVNSAPVPALRLRIGPDPAPAGSGSPVVISVSVAPGNLVAATVSPREAPGAGNLAVFPVGSLASLSSGPVGGLGVTGVAAATSPPSRVSLRAAEQPFVADVVRLTVLTQVSGAEEEPPRDLFTKGNSNRELLPRPTPLTDERTSPEAPSRNRTLDVIFAAPEWATRMLGDREDPELPPPADALAELSVKRGPEAELAAGITNRTDLAPGASVSEDSTPVLLAALVVGALSRPLKQRFRRVATELSFSPGRVKGAFATWWMPPDAENGA
jgi:hypothetical protein